ncbi:unnamed protein product [Hymenolepis diminuta]|uniref:Uncharacterized protein n=1 Tax=Hymenolepis diminuta TaxID=6216 RepID=A0A3P7BBM2_HYMDI|nr:unnamed protein product [Hymenolepis diminuta]
MSSLINMKVIGVCASSQRQIFTLFSIELDSVAQQHNIFHCPVEKEVSNWLNPVLRLNCGHRVSFDRAFDTPLPLLLLLTCFNMASCVFCAPFLFCFI